MSFKNAYIPYGQYWSTPFSRWQMSPIRYSLKVIIKKPTLLIRGQFELSFLQPTKYSLRAH